MSVTHSLVLELKLLLGDRGLQVPLGPNTCPMSTNTRAADSKCRMVAPLLPGDVIDVPSGGLIHPPKNSG